MTITIDELEQLQARLIARKGLDARLPEIERELNVLAAGMPAIKTDVPDAVGAAADLVAARALIASARAKLKRAG